MTDSKKAAMRRYEIVSGCGFLIMVAFAVGFSLTSNWTRVVGFIAIAAVFGWLWIHWRRSARQHREQSEA